MRTKRPKLPPGWEVHDLIVPFDEVVRPENSFVQKGRTYNNVTDALVKLLAAEFGFYRAGKLTRDVPGDWGKGKARVTYLLSHEWAGPLGSEPYPRVHFAPTRLIVAGHDNRLYFLVTMSGHVDQVVHRPDDSRQGDADAVRIAINHWSYNRFRGIHIKPVLAPGALLR